MDNSREKNPTGVVLMNVGKTKYLILVELSFELALSAAFTIFKTFLSNLYYCKTVKAFPSKEQVYQLIIVRIAKHSFRVGVETAKSET